MSLYTFDQLCYIDGKVYTTIFTLIYTLLNKFNCVVKRVYLAKLSICLDMISSMQYVNIYGTYIRTRISLLV